MNIEIKTLVTDNGDIHQQCLAENQLLNGVTYQISYEILRTKEEQIKQALIGLGWTPPGGHAELLKDSQ